MSPEPKPRSMAAVTITVLRWNFGTCVRCLSKIWLYAGTSEYLSVLPVRGVTICRVRTISRKDYVTASKLNVESSEAIRQTSWKRRKRWSDLCGDMQSVAEPK